MRAVPSVPQRRYEFTHALIFCMQLLILIRIHIDKHRFFIHPVPELTIRYLEHLTRLHAHRALHMVIGMLEILGKTGPMESVPARVRHGLSPSRKTLMAYRTHIVVPVLSRVGGRAIHAAKRPVKPGRTRRSHDRLP